MSANPNSNLSMSCKLSMSLDEIIVKNKQDKRQSKYLLLEQ
jgi:hypothetical protein